MGIHLNETFCATLTPTVQSSAHSEVVSEQTETFVQFGGDADL
jgi:hypothetical protein